MRPLNVCAPTLLIALAALSSSALAQGAFPLSAELGLSLGHAGHGVGLGGKVSVRVTPGSWGLGVRLMGMDGARRRATSCFIFCNPIESFTEKSALVYRRIVRSDGSRIYLGAGVGRLSGRRFIGSSADFDRDVSELGLSFEASAYLPGGAGIRFAPGAYGHVGSGGVVLGVTVGVAFTG